MIAHWNRVQGSSPASSIRATAKSTNTSAATTRSQRSHHGRPTFTPAQLKRIDIGWRLSFETAAANCQSRLEGGFTRRSFWCAAFAKAQSLSYAVFRGVGRTGNSGSAPYHGGDAECSGRWLSRKSCSLLSGSADRVASSLIRPLTNARAVSKSAPAIEFRVPFVSHPTRLSIRR